MIVFSGKINTNDVSLTLSKVNEAASNTGSTVVLFDADKTAGKEHILAAAEHAKRAFESKTNISRSLAMEILLYASGQRQCSLASRFGLHKGENNVYVLILGGDEEAAKPELLNLISEGPVDFPKIETLQSEFGITDDELAVTGTERITELVVERVALADVWK